MKIRKITAIAILFIIILSSGVFGANIITQTNANFPFPLSKAYTYGIYSTSYSNSNLLNLYNTWKTHYVVAASGYDRVERPDQSNDTVSEGMGYGMLMAVYFNDAALYNNLWSYMQLHLDSNTLMVWNLNSDGSNKASPADSATDADEDIAFSVLMAARQFGPTPGVDDTNIRATAMTEEGYVLSHDIDSSTSAVNPGDQWNTWYYPSYWDPAYYAEWANIDTTNSAKWNAVLTAMTTWAGGGCRSTANGLIGDSCLANGAVENGDPCNSGGNGSCNGLDYLYNSCRVPWRFELYYTWNGVDSATELQYISVHFNTIAATAIEDGYVVSSGAVTGTNHNACFTGPIGCSFMRNYNGYQTTLNNYCTETGSFAPNSYYNDSWQILSLLLMTGNYWNLLNLQGGTPTFTPTITQTPSAALLDTFEDGDAINNWGGAWYSYYGTTGCANDTTTVWPKAQTTFVMTAPGWPGSPYGSAYCARITGYVYTTYCSTGCNNSACTGTIYYPCVGLGTNVDRVTSTTRDVSAFSGFVMAIKGDGTHQYSLRFMPNSVTNTGYNDFKYTFIPPTTWTQMQIPFSDLTQETGWGTKVSLTLVLQHLLQINWQTYDYGHAVDLSIDDVGFYPSLGWTPTPINTKTVTPTLTPPPAINTMTVTPTDTRSATPTSPPSTNTYTSTPTPTLTDTSTPLPNTNTNTPTPSWTRTDTLTNTPTNTPTGTNTPLPNTSTDTPTATGTRTDTQTNTPTGTSTGTPSFTATRTNTATNTPTGTQTPSYTITMTFTQIIVSATITPTFTITKTITPTYTYTYTPSNTPINTVTNTPSSTGTRTNTPTNTSTGTQTPSYTITMTFTQIIVSATFTPTYSVTPTITATKTNTPSPTRTYTITATYTINMPLTNTITPTATRTDTPTVPTATPTIAIDLVANITVSPASVGTGQDITVVMQVQNTGTGTANNVAPSALSQSGGGAATLVSGPSPASATIGSNASASFTWVYNIVICSNITFNGTASGTDAGDGVVMTSTSAASNAFTCATPTYTPTLPTAPTATFTPTVPSSLCQVDKIANCSNQDAWGGYWYTYNDAGSTVWPSGAGAFVMSSPGYDNGTDCAAQLTGTVDAGGQIGMGMQLNANAGSPTYQVTDLSGAIGIRFYVKGDGATYEIKIPYTNSSGTELDGYDSYAYTFTAPAGWTLVTVPFSSLKQAGWGTAVALLTVLQNAKEVQFQTTAAPLASVDLWVDNFEIYGCGATATNTPPPGPTATNTPQPVCQLDTMASCSNQNAWGGYWYTYNDAASTVWPSTASGPFVMSSPGFSTGADCAALMTGSVAAAGGYIGMGTQLNGKAGSPTYQTTDISGAIGIRFETKGDGATYEIKIPYTNSSGTELDGYDSYAYTFTAPAGWTLITIPFTSFKQAGWGTAEPLNTVLQNAKEVQFQTTAAPQASVTLWIDNFEIYCNVPTVTVTTQVVNTATYTVTPSATGTNTTVPPTLTSTSTSTGTQTATPTITATPTYTITMTVPPGSTMTNTPTITPTIAINLAASLTVSPGSAATGQYITVVMLVANTGANTADNVAPSVLSQSGGGAATLVSGPSPANATINGNSSDSFTWVYAVVIANNITFNGTVSGTDAVDGVTEIVASAASNLFTCATATVTVTPAITNTLTATPTVAINLVINSLTISPSSAVNGQNITIVMQVQNTGANTANNVAPSSLVLTSGGGGSATLVSGPSPANATMAKNAQASFTWVYTVSSTTGTVTFNATVSGTDSVDGVTVTSASAMSNACSCSSATKTPTPALSTATMTPIAVPTGVLTVGTVLPYPNPINPTVWPLNIRVNVTTDNIDSMKVKIYTTAYRLIMQKEFDGPSVENGVATLTFDIKDLYNLSEGAYYYVVIAEKGGVTVRSKVDKIIILK